MATSQLPVHADRFHLVCRSARSEVPWLRPCRPSKLSYNEQVFRDEMRRDVCRLSTRTLAAVLDNAHEPQWLRSLAAAELMLRRLDS